VAATPEEDDQLEKDLGNAVGEKTGSAGVANKGHETKVKETKKK
jgi:hypothetical protein